MITTGEGNMTIEVPVLRLGLAGFSEAQQKTAADLVKAAKSPRAEWQLAPFSEADSWWLDGARTHLLPSGILRVQPGMPSGRSVQLALADVDRPVAFTLPLSAPDFQPAVTFDLASREQGAAVLNQFAFLMQLVLAQFCLASSISENQPTLAKGSWEVLKGPELLAVVDLRLGAGVSPTATAADFESASWCLRDHGAVLIPPHFPRVSVSQLMWQYSLRTQRDLLPPHYRTQPLYYRRPPRLKHKQLRDAHLLLLRELDAQPGMTFYQLQEATGLGEAPLARHLSALYVVGSITANRMRAIGAGSARRGEDSSPGVGASVFTSELDPSQFTEVLRRPRAVQRSADRTAPAPLLPDRTAPAPLAPDTRG